MKCSLWLRLGLPLSCSYFSCSSGVKAKVVPNLNSSKVYGEAMLGGNAEHFFQNFSKVQAARAKFAPVGKRCS